MIYMPLMLTAPVCVCFWLEVRKSATRALAFEAVSKERSSRVRHDDEPLSPALLLAR